MTIVNLTPHAVNLHLPTGEVKVFPPAPEGPARVSQTRQQIGTVDGTPVNRSTFGAVTGLPAPQLGTYYIVSLLVATACPDRTDLLCPDDVVRDAEGRIVGCRAWCRP